MLFLAYFGAPFFFAFDSDSCHYVCRNEHNQNILPSRIGDLRHTAVAHFGQCGRVFEGVNNAKGQKLNGISQVSR